MPIFIFETRFRNVARGGLLGAALILAFGGGGAAASSVVPVPTSLRITPATLDLVDPVDGTSAGGAGSYVRYAIGDILTFRVAATGLPNAANRGLGAYLTVYVPANCEVVGARFVDASGATVFPPRGGLAQDGAGPLGPRGYPSPLEEGSISQLYADTGIFFSTDPRTARVPLLDFPTVLNGEGLPVSPTGAAQVDDSLGFTGPPFFTHNHWDWIQVNAFGTIGSIGPPPGGDVNTSGRGNTPFGYGSPVAGSLTFYALEATETAPSLIQAVGATGPWQRVRYPGSEIGKGLPTPGSGPLLRVGIPTAAGWSLSTVSPLPRSTNAVRFAMGEVSVATELLAEISLRVLAAPLDPGLDLDAVCAEIFAGDFSATSTTSGALDNPWRYFVPAPVCVDLGLRLELDVDKNLATVGDVLHYTIRARNLSGLTRTNVVLTDRFTPSEVALVAASGNPILGSGMITWPPIPSWPPGAEFQQTVDVSVIGSTAFTRHSATLTSDQVPSPGYSVMAVSALGAISKVRLSLSASPSTVAPGGSVRYAAVVANEGTASLSPAGCTTPPCQYALKLPAGFTVMAGTSTINSLAVADPSFTGGAWIYTSGLPTLAAGTSATLELGAQIDLGVPTGLHSSCFEIWLTDSGTGRRVEDEKCGIGAVAVGAERSVPPVLLGPVGAGAQCVAGTTAEPDGSAVQLLVDGPLRATTTAAGGIFATCMQEALFGGQRITATIAAPGELESLPSAALVVSSGSVPGEVVDLRASTVGGATTLTWTAPTTGGSSSSLAYDTLRSAVPSDFAGAANCLESGDGLDTTATDPAVPLAGGAFFYRVRARNNFGPGPLGTDSSGHLIAARDCP